MSVLVILAYLLVTMKAKVILYLHYNVMVDIVSLGIMTVSVQVLIPPIITLQCSAVPVQVMELLLTHWVAFFQVLATL